VWFMVPTNTCPSQRFMTCDQALQSDTPRRGAGLVGGNEVADRTHKTGLRGVFLSKRSVQRREDHLGLGGGSILFDTDLLPDHPVLMIFSG
jgi:hypothetical protein